MKNDEYRQMIGKKLSVTMILLSVKCIHSSTKALL